MNTQAYLSKLVSFGSRVSDTRLPAVVVTMATLSAVFMVHAAPLDLADSPLEAGVAVPPNVLIVSDDSGSMDWEVVVRGESQSYPVLRGGGETFRARRLYSSTSEEVIPTQEALNAHADFPPNAYGVWRFRNSDYNKIYYDPRVTYRPWIGFSSNTAAATDNFKKVPVLPGSVTTIDLTVKHSQTSEDFPDADGDEHDIVSEIYFPYYYTWADADADSVVDAGEGTYVKIESTDTAGMENFANWFTFYRKREFVAKAALSFTLENIDGIRAGYNTINNNNSASSMTLRELNLNPNEGVKKDLLAAIYATNSDGGTPLRYALRKAGRHFGCDAGDIFGSTANSSPGDAACPIFTKSNGGACQQNYTILISDGGWNDTDFKLTGDESKNDTDKNTSNPYDGGAFEGETKNVKNSLADVAMNYYKNDLHASLDDKVPTTAIDRDRGGSNSALLEMHQHMSTYTVGFGLSGNVTDMPATVTSTVDWGDPINDEANPRLDDMRHAAYNGRGQYYSATSPEELARDLEQVLEEIKAGVGTSSAVSFNTQKLQTDTLIMRASFNSRTNTGDLVAQEVDANFNVLPTIKWSAAKQLDSKTPDSRVIVTYKRSTFPTFFSQGVPFRYASLGDYQKAAIAEKEVNWLRGSRADERPTGTLRKRESTEGLLGDIVHSSPLFVGMPFFSSKARTRPLFPSGDESYVKFKQDNATRKPLVYVGANDGMLHSFDALTGEEMFAYVPETLISDASSDDNLQKFTDHNYRHRYFVDMSPAADDVYIRKRFGSDKAWHTVLVGGMGAGGRGYFALDITDPTAFNTEANAAKNVMWEFSNRNDSDVGYGISPPVIAMTNEDNGSDKQWRVFFGNGYNSDSGVAKLFALKMEGPDNILSLQSYYKISTGEGPKADGTPNGLGPVRGVDKDDNGTIDVAYAGDLKGNLFRFNLDAGTYKKIYTAVDASGKAQPITTRPIVVAHPQDANSVVVVFTTGQWLTDADATNIDTQSIYGVWDDGSNTPVSFTRTNLVQQVYTNTTFTGTDGAGNAITRMVRTLSNNTIDWTTKKGWFIDLNVKNAAGVVAYPGERAIRNLEIRGPFAFVNSVFPFTNRTCDTPGGGASLAFDPQTGGSGIKQIFDTNNDGVFDNKDSVSSSIVGGLVWDSTPTDFTFIGSRIFSQGKDLKVRSIDTNTKSEVDKGRLSWGEVKHEY